VVIDDEGHRGGPATNEALVHATDTFAKQEHRKVNEHNAVSPTA
jgi:hypothetical protein